MTDWTNKHIFFVDDEPQICKAVGNALERTGYRVSCFSRAVDCLEQLHRAKCDLLITDVKMPEMDGMTLLTEAKRIVPLLPVLVVTGYGDIPMAVRAIKAGASDFIEKPLQRETFLSAVGLALKRSVWPGLLANRGLTKVEMKVLGLVLSGKSSKEIALLLNRSVRTVEDHRRHIMGKFGARNLVELVTRAIELELIEVPPKG